MSIIYPLTPPSGHRTAQKIKLTAWTRTSASESPYTGQQQIYQWPGEGWLLDVALPPMKMADAEPWIAFLTALRGRAGTFLFGDTARKTPQGTATTGDPYPSCNATIAAGSATIATRSWTPNASGILKAGDYLQIVANELPHPFDFTAWSKSSDGGADVPTVTAGASDPFGGTGAYTLSFAAMGAEQWSQVIDYIPTTVSNSQKTNGEWTIYLKASSATTLWLAIEDTPYLYQQLGAITANLTTSWQRFVVPMTNPSKASAVGMNCIMRNLPNEGSKTVYAYRSCLGFPYLRARLHKVLADVNSDTNGNADVDIFPRTREGVIWGTRLVTSVPRGTFRLATDQTQWDIDHAKMYGISFQAVEAI